ncbi:olfactory receptor 6C70-like [Takifugu flavidus]|uniref:olfactory receptor 6C70-like n=1 Tax=Takifugu flavidus TaxID=433684 RepID=UPI00254417DC|nr:olfactory receptor 6C70-like [Takifugu flavidus]
MENKTETVYFVLAAYGDTGELKYVYFGIMLFWFVSIWMVNSVLILIIYKDKKLHKPMYIFVCNLFVNEISGSTSLYPLMLSQMLSDTHQVTVPWCFLQMCYIYASISVEFYSLAAMAYDRYVAICYPLQYSLIMNTGRVCKIISAVWGYSFINFFILLLFLINLDLCGNIIDKVFCDYYLITQLSCSVSLIEQISELCLGFLTVIVPFCLVLISYQKILAVCLKGSKENARKAASTCTPQIVSVSNLFIGCTFHIVDSRTNFTGSQVPVKVRIIFSVYLLIFQPMVTPFMYGFNLPKIRQACKRFCLNNK